MLSYLLAALLSGVIVNYEVQPYKVVGSSLSEVLSSIRELGPKDQHGISRHAYAGWDIRWSWDKGIKNPKVRLKLTLIHPAWDGNCAEWGRYMDAILRHEMNHLNNSIKTASKILKTIESSEGLSEEELNQRLAILLQKNREFDLQYDKDTHHGLHEGVLIDTDKC